MICFVGQFGLGMSTTPLSTGFGFHFPLFSVVEVLMSVGTSSVPFFGGTGSFASFSLLGTFTHVPFQFVMTRSLTSDGCFASGCVVGFWMVLPSPFSPSQFLLITRDVAPKLKRRPFLVVFLKEGSTESLPGFTLHPSWPCSPLCSFRSLSISFSKQSCPAFWKVTKHEPLQTCRKRVWDTHSLVLSWSVA